MELLDMINYYDLVKTKIMFASGKDILIVYAISIFKIFW